MKSSARITKFGRLAPQTRHAVSRLKNKKESIVKKECSIPPTSALSVLRNNSAARSVLAQPSIVIGRQLEMMNVFLGFEQANKYAIKDANNCDVGFIAEEESTVKGTVLRQLMKTRRAFDGIILDTTGKPVLLIKRPVKWLLNSEIAVTDMDGVVIGEVRQVWHLWRRKYELFINQKQVGAIDGELMTWDFNILDKDGMTLASVNRNFGGFVKEIFTDAGQYMVRLDDASGKKELSLDERALIIAAAINIDIDFFSRHSNHSGGMGGIFPFIPFFGMGGNSSSEAPIDPTSGDIESGAADGDIPNDGGFLPDESESSGSFFDFLDDE